MFSAQLFQSGAQFGAFRAEEVVRKLAINSVCTLKMEKKQMYKSQFLY